MIATLEQIGQRALSSTSTLESSYDLARLCIERGVPGDFVECGVFAGVQAAAMAKALMDLGCTDRRVHLFDSFAGIPKAGKHDNDLRPLVGSGGMRESSGVSVCPIGDVQNHMAQWGIDPSLLVWHEGWFEDTVPAAKIDKIALLRLDGDLYESTKVCVQHLYPNLSVGGWCIVDDWNLDGCRAAIAETIGHQAPVYFQKQ